MSAEPIPFAAELAAALEAAAEAAALLTARSGADAVREKGRADLVTVPAAIPGTIANAVWPTPWEWLFLLGVGASAQAGQVYLTRGLQLVPAGRAAGAAYMQVVFAALWGALFFGELPDSWVLVGAMIILGSTLLLGRLHAGPTAPAPASDDAASEATEATELETR